jgi:hypothetical protein
VAKGKYQEWLEPDGLLLLRGWARDGLTDEQIAKNMGVALSTYYKWQLDHAEIAEALKKGKAPVDIEVEDALLKRAKGYDYEEVITEVYGDGKKHVKKIKKHMPPDVGAIVFWLKNRKKGLWRDRPENDGEKVEPVNIIIDV